MAIEIRHKETGDLLYHYDADSLDGVDLSNANLRGASLAGLRLRNADFRNAKLEEADLSGADCRHANFHNAKLEKADLSGADCRHANFRGAKLTSACLDSADLTAARLEHVSLHSASLADANLEEADLSRATLKWADVSGVRFGDAIISEANFFAADLRGADLATAAGFDSATLADVLHDATTRWPDTYVATETYADPELYPAAPFPTRKDAPLSVERPFQFTLSTIFVAVTCAAIFFALARLEFGKALFSFTMFVAGILSLLAAPAILVLYVFQNRRWKVSREQSEADEP